MNIAVRLLLFVFITFLSTPTIVSLIEKSCDTTVFYTMTEEEQVHKEIKLVFELNHYELVFYPDRLSSEINSECFSKHDNISSAIFIPPPEQV
ncbi:MAG TPA: hypothetical protein VGB44_11420 [Flavobacterium sp.]